MELETDRIETGDIGVLRGAGTGPDIEDTRVDRSRDPRANTVGPHNELRPNLVVDTVPVAGGNPDDASGAIRQGACDIDTGAD